MEEIENTFLQKPDDGWDPQDSILLKKIIGMMEYAYPVLRNFPKSEKFSMAADIKRCMDAMMERTIEADCKHYKKTTLQELDVENKKLMKYLLVACRLKFIGQRQYGTWTGKAAEIGKIIGGRIKDAKAREEKR
ncbi:MAG: diversity-generating retroelement protein Avd [Clostridia bacterium]|nr:diversity-generating retroelement protein Avd [Clostridia bacterium]